MEKDNNEKRKYLKCSGTQILPELLNSSDSDMSVKINEKISSKTQKTRYSIEDKVKILKEAKLESPSNICKKYEVSERTLRQWKLKKDNIIELSKNEKIKHAVTVRSTPLNDAVYAWFCEAQKKVYPITGAMIKQKAIDLNKEIGINSNFKASEGWLSNWKLKFLKITDTSEDESRPKKKKFKSNAEHGREYQRKNKILKIKSQPKTSRERQANFHLKKKMSMLSQQFIAQTPLTSHSVPSPRASIVKEEVFIKEDGCGLGLTQIDERNRVKINIEDFETKFLKEGLDFRNHSENWDTDEPSISEKTNEECCKDYRERNKLQEQRKSRSAKTSSEWSKQYREPKKLQEAGMDVCPEDDVKEEAFMKEEVDSDESGLTQIDERNRVKTNIEAFETKFLKENLYSPNHAENNDTDDMDVYSEGESSKCIVKEEAFMKEEVDSDECGLTN